MARVVAAGFLACEPGAGRPASDGHRVGPRWDRRALAVPSAIVEVEENVLLDPAHADLARLVVHQPRAFPFDARLK